MGAALGRSLRFGLLFGLLLSVTVAAVMCVWEWLENPGGIFHDADGTNWGFVYDTATSWFVPTVSPSVVLATVAHYLYRRISTD